MGLILDTSILIAAERGQFDMPAFLEKQADVNLVISAITASELLHGCERAKDLSIRQKRTQYVEGILARIPIIEFGLNEARHHARLWAYLQNKGFVIGAHDLLIAATAVSLKLGLATRNQKEFERIPDLKLVEI